MRDDMLKNLKRGDRVGDRRESSARSWTSRDADVMLKVDESSNSKIKFTRDAIKRVLTDDEATSTK